MVKSELVQRSPLRIFEKSIHGGLKPGQIGVLASKKGVGKTACLVHIATDKLFNGKHVIHVSFSSRVDHIVTWYEDIFKEIAKKRSLENAVEVHDEIIRNRVIMNFSQKGTNVHQVLKSISAMIEDGHFAADTLVVDGFDFAQAQPSDLDAIKAYAREKNITVWFSVSLNSDNPRFDEHGFPEDLTTFNSYLDVVISLKYKGDNVQLSLIKEGGQLHAADMHLILDPRTMLIVEE
ncbi:MAG: hypothetical protein JXB03_09500 [Spirochaetales bacterium]|nr:hypothetical protein [Spirochaetales bacterium]